MTTTPQKYKQTEIGSIPEDWEVGSMMNDSTLKARIGWQGLTTSEYLNMGEYFLVTGTDFFDGKIKWETCYYVAQERFVQDKNIQLKVNDILVTKDGTIGKVTFIDKVSLPTTLNSGIFVIRPKNKTYHPQFLYFVLKSFYFNDFLNQLVAGSTILHLYQKDFVNFKFPLPQIPEQTAIANALNDADALITQLEKLIAKKRQIKQGAMQELLKPKEGWVEKKFTEIISKDSGIKIGPFGSQLKKELLVNEGFKVYGQENVFEKNMDLGSRYLNKEHFNKLKSCELLSGDFIISMMGTIGKCMIVPDSIQKGIMDSHLIRLRLNKTILDIDYLYHYFSSEIILSQVEKLSVGGIMAGLSSKIIKNLQIILPQTLKEQTQIAQTLSDMDAEIAGLEQKLDKYRKLKAGMMQNLLTGKIRLI